VFAKLSSLLTRRRLAVGLLVGLALALQIGATSGASSNPPNDAAPQQGQNQANPNKEDKLEALHKQAAGKKSDEDKPGTTKGAATAASPEQAMQAGSDAIKSKKGPGNQPTGPAGVKTITLTKQNGKDVYEVKGEDGSTAHVDAGNGQVLDVK